MIYMEVEKIIHKVPSNTWARSEFLDW